MYFSTEPMVTGAVTVIQGKSPSHKRPCGHNSANTSGSELVDGQSSTLS